MKVRVIHGSGCFKLASTLCVVALAAGCASAPPEPTAAPSPAKQESPAVQPAPAAAAKQPEPEAPIVTPAPKAEPVKPVADAAPMGEPEAAPAKKPETAPAPPPVTAAKPTAPAKADTPAPKKSSSPNTFLVTSAPKDKSHPFFGQGSEHGFYVDGVAGKDVVVTRGETYTFDVETGVQHDFYLSTTPAGWGAATYTDGVTGQFTYQGLVGFKPTATTPDVLYYGCRNHKFMGGAIYVVNKGEKPKIKQHSVGDTSGPAFKVTAQQVKQKMAYGQMLLGSDSVKKVGASDNAEAKGLVTEATNQFTTAKTLLDKGDNPQAMAAVDEGLRLLNAATRLTATTLVEKDYKADYEGLSKEVKGYYKSYQRNVKNQSSDKLTAKFDDAKFNKLVGDAENAAARGDYKAASEGMHKASAMVTGALSVVMESSTVVYEQDFASPQDEYEFEQARYESYHELIPLAIEQRHPTAQQVEIMNEFVAKAERIVGEGKPYAERGDYATAIQALQAATDNLKRALMIAGVR